MNNPQAFPQNITAAGVAYPGMYLRDYFAGQALNGYCTQELNSSDEKVAYWAYEIANAMLKEREKYQKSEN